MPSPWKKPRAGSALARFISSLRQDRRSGAAGSLPVQTGFPTSLADLYVKNQSRLKKPSNKSKRKRQAANLECVSTVGSSADVSDSPTSPVLSSSGCTGFGEVVAEEQRIPSVSDDVSVCERRSSLGLGFVAIVNIFVLLLLAIFGKKLVVGFTALAFLSWFFDSVRLDLVQLFKPCAEVSSTLNLEERSFAVVSPIREVEIQTESDSIELEIQDELIQSREFDEIQLETPDLCEVSTRNLKKKSIFKKLFSKKRCKRKAQVEKESPLDDSSIRSKERKTISISEEMEAGEIVNLVPEESQDEQFNREISPTREILRNCEIKEGFSWLVVLLMVILFGLVEGKAVALALTIFCFISLSFLELARKSDWKERISLAR